MTGQLNLFINTPVFRGAGVEAGAEKLARIGILELIFKELKSESRLSRGRNVDPDKIQLLKDEIEQKLPEVLSNLEAVSKEM